MTEPERPLNPPEQPEADPRPDLLCCPDCRCTDVHELQVGYDRFAWIEVNTGLNTGDEGPLDTYWCPQCDASGDGGETKRLDRTHDPKPFAEPILTMNTINAAVFEAARPRKLGRAVEVTAEVYDYFLGVVPPYRFASHGYLVGEADSHSPAGLAIRSQFTQKDGKYFHQSAETKS